MAVDAQKLLLELLRADLEEEVVRILTKAGFWDDPEAWRDLGDQPENYPTVGGQQPKAEQALVEKLVNSIDARLIAAVRTAGVNPEDPATAPANMIQARDRYFGSQLDDLDALAQGTTVAATGSRAPGRMSITIADNGEGQTPSAMPKTILSVHQGSKGKTAFVQGKFHMGGTGVLEFCGERHNVQLVLSKRHPALLPTTLADPMDAHWSFTIVRREDPTPSRPRSSTFTYLAPGPVDEKGRRSLLHFDASTLAIFPRLNQAYAREASSGTLFKLYEYGLRLKGNIILSDALMEKVRVLLPAPALPIRFHECRQGFKGHSGSFDTTMKGLLATLDDDYKSSKRDNVEWFDRFDLHVDGEKFSVRMYVFKNSKAAAVYRSDEGIVYTYNGQSHTVLSKDFFRRDAVKQDYLWQSLLLFVDCSALSPRAHERLFMTSRAHQRDNEFKRAIEHELEDKLRHHPKLAEIATIRRDRERAEQPAASETFRKFLEEMVRKYPHLALLLGPGLKIANPFKPLSVVAAEQNWTGVRFPTRFHFRHLAPSQALRRDANLNSQVRITFETDAQDDYFSREEDGGSFTLSVVTTAGLVPATNWKSPTLFRGLAHVSLALPPDTRVGDEVTFEAVVDDPSRVEPFRNRFTLVVLEERKPAAPPQPSPSPAPKPPSTKAGPDRSNDSYLGVPEPIEVTEAHWRDQDPPFDKMTALVIKAAPGAEEGAVLHDYYVNMDNVFLQDAIKRRPKQAATHRNQFKLGMAMLAFSLVQQDFTDKAKASPPAGDDDASGEGLVTWNIGDQVQLFSTAMAPFILPMIATLSSLPEERDPVLASAGEAA